MNSNGAVDGIFVYSFVVGHVNSQLGGTNTECQAVDLLQSKPMFILWISKSFACGTCPFVSLGVLHAFFVFGPVPVEVHLNMSSSLEHDPLSIFHVTKYFEWLGIGTVWCNSVDPILSTSSLIDLLTVPRYGIPRWCT